MQKARPKGHMKLSTKRSSTGICLGEPETSLEKAFRRLHVLCHGHDCHRPHAYSKYR